MGLKLLIYFRQVCYCVGLYLGRGKMGQRLVVLVKSLSLFCINNQKKIIKDLIAGQHLNFMQHGQNKIIRKTRLLKNRVFYQYQKYWSEKYQLYSMLKKNSTKNIHTVSTRIITTNKLPKDFFLPIVRPIRLLDMRKKSCESSDIVKSAHDSSDNGLLFTFYRSRSSNLKIRALNEVQQSKPLKQRQSCPVTLNYEQIWNKENKQNGVLQKKGRTLYKITRKTLTLDYEKKNELKIDSLKY